MQRQSLDYFAPGQYAAGSHLLNEATEEQKEIETGGRRWWNCDDGE
jgi:hypothetical protein